MFDQACPAVSGLLVVDTSDLLSQSICRRQGHEVVGTTTSPGRLAELCDLVDHPRLYNARDPMADTSFLDRLDGVLIAMAPTTATFEEDQYEKVYGQAVPALVDAIRQRQGLRAAACVVSEQCRGLWRSVRCRSAMS